ncbi:hypothetical protein Egran_06533 [Elaphomyces granulatus]|uniref:Uncharacterized protein n=1 Tax=Elaphomyces granulatus TaxID=519963 RepID=A0A232LNI1_9EURO|nr:hypothetical protein Egran_06533 [Elaphomyces granulatus]
MSLPPTVESLIRASEKLTIKNEILKHENAGLRAALVNEKKRRKRGKKLGLFDNENPGEAQFFSPNKVQALRQRAEEAETQKEQEREAAVRRQAERALEREQKAREVQERKEERVRKREEKARQKEFEKEERRAAREAKKQHKDDKQEQRSRNKARKPRSEHVEECEEEIPTTRQEMATSRSGRQIRLPERFRN